MLTESSLFQREDFINAKCGYRAVKVHNTRLLLAPLYDAFLHLGLEELDHAISNHATRYVLPFVAQYGKFEDPPLYTPLRIEDIQKEMEDLITFEEGKTVYKIPHDRLVPCSPAILEHWAASLPAAETPEEPEKEEPEIRQSLPPMGHRVAGEEYALSQADTKSMIPIEQLSIGLGTCADRSRAVLIQLNETHYMLPMDGALKLAGALKAALEIYVEEGGTLP